MKASLKCLGLVAVLAACLLSAATVFAVEYTWNWTSGGRNWETAANWLPATGYPGSLAEDVAVFADTGVGAVNITTAVGTLPFDSINLQNTTGSYTISSAGAALSVWGISQSNNVDNVFTSGLSINGGLEVFADAGTLTFSGPIGESLAGSILTLKKNTGATGGTVIFNGAAPNGFSGDLYVQGVNLQVSNDSVLGGATSNLHLDAGTLQVDTTGAAFSSGRGMFLDGGNSTLKVVGTTPANTATFSGTMGGLGALTIDAGSNRTIVFTGSKAFEGGLSLKSGTLVASDDLSLGKVGNSVGFAGGTLAIETPTAAYASTRGLNFGPAGGTVKVLGTLGASFSGTVTAAGPINVGPTASALTLSGQVMTTNQPINLVDNGTLRVTNTDATAVNDMTGSVVTVNPGSTLYGTSAWAVSSLKGASIVLNRGTLSVGGGVSGVRIGAITECFYNNIAQGTTGAPNFPSIAAQLQPIDAVTPGPPSYSGLLLLKNPGSADFATGILASGAPLNYNVDGAMVTRAIALNPAFANTTNNWYGATWEGQMDVTTAGWYTFVTGSDDGSVLYIDLDGNGTYNTNQWSSTTQTGELIVNNNYDQGQTYRGTSAYLQPGDYSFVIGFRQGTGGNTMNALWQPGNLLAPNTNLGAIAVPGLPAGYTTYIAGDGNIGTSLGEFTTSSVTVQDDSYIVSNASLSNFGPLTIAAGKKLTAQGTGPISFASTTASGTVTFSTDVDVTTGTIINGGGLAAIIKQGPANLILNDYTNLAGLPDGTILDVQSGGVAGVAVPGGSTSFGATTLNVPVGAVNAQIIIGSTQPAASGDGVVINPFNFADSVTLRGAAVGGGVTGGSVSFGTAGGITMPAGATLTLATSNNYTLKIPGPVVSDNTTANGKVVLEGGLTTKVLNMAGGANVSGAGTVQMTGAPPSITYAGGSTATTAFLGAAQLNLGGVTTILNVARGATASTSDLTITSPITSGGMTVTGGGIVTLMNGTNDYAGGTAIQAGSKVVMTGPFGGTPGTVVGSGPITLSSGGILAMSGPTPFVAGLEQGRIAGAGINTTAANPKDRGIVLEPIAGQRQKGTTWAGGTTTNQWGDNETWVYTGQFYNPNPTVSFAADIDDAAWMAIDGVAVPGGAGWQMTSGIWNIGMGPNGDGWHAIDIRFYNGGGGGGATGRDAGWIASSYGFGFNPVATAAGNNGTNYIKPVDPNDATLFRRLGTPTPYMGHNPLNVTDTGTVDLTAYATGAIAGLGQLGLGNGATLTVNGADRTLNLDGTTLQASGTIDGSGNVTLGQITIPPTGATLNILTTGAAVLNDNVIRAGLPVDLHNLSIQIGAGGRLTALGGGTGTCDPIGGAAVSIGQGGILQLSSTADGSPAFLDNITFTGDGTIEHGGSFTDTIGSLSQPITLPANRTLTLNALAGTLIVAGDVNGATTLAKTGPGTVILGGAGLGGYVAGPNVNVTGGMLKLGAADRLGSDAALAISNSAAFDLNGFHQGVNTVSLGSGAKIQGGGTLTMNAPNPTIGFTGGSTATTATINAAQLNLNGNATTLNVVRGATTSGSDVTISSQISSGSLTVTGGGIVTLANGTNDYTSTVIQGGAQVVMGVVPYGTPDDVIGPGPVTLSGGGKLVLGGQQTLTAGLQEGRLILDTGGAPSQGVIPANSVIWLGTQKAFESVGATVNQSATPPATAPWGSTETWGYSGWFYSANSTVAFGGNIDDGWSVKVDNNPAWTYVGAGNTTWTTPAWNIGVGWHEIDLRVYNGGGGAGSTRGGLGSGFDPGGTHGTFGSAGWLATADPGDGSVFRVAGPFTPYEGDNTVEVLGTDTGTIDLSNGATRSAVTFRLGVLTMHSGGTLNVTGPGRTVAFDGTRLEAGTTNFTGDGYAGLGPITMVGGSATISAQGAGGTLLNYAPATGTPNDLTNLTVNVISGGAGGVLGGGAGTTDPFGGATFNVADGGTLVFSSVAAGSPAMLGQNGATPRVATFAANATIRHIGPYTDTLGDETHPIVMAEGYTLTLDSQAGVGIVAGNISPSPNSIVKTGAAVMQLKGTAESASVIVNAGTLQMGGLNRLINPSVAVTVNRGGTFDFNGYSQATSSFLVNYGGTAASGAGVVTIPAIQLVGSTLQASAGGTINLPGGLPTYSGLAAIVGPGVLNPPGAPGTTDYTFNLTTPLFVSATLAGAGNTVTKTGPAALILAGSSTFGDATHGTTVSGGILRTDRDANLGSLAAPLTVTGATLQTRQGFTVTRTGGYTFAGATLDIPRTSWLTRPENAGWDLNNVASMSDANLTVALGSTLTKTGQGTFSIANNQTNFQGSLVIGPDAGTVELAGGMLGWGRLNNIQGIEVGQGSVLAAKQIGNTVMVNPTDGFLSDTATMTLRGGTLWVLGSWNGKQQEQIGPIQLASGASTVHVNYNGDGTANYTLRAASLAGRETGSTVLFRGANLQGTGNNSSQILFSTAPTLSNGIIGGWAIANNSGSGNGGLNPGMGPANTDFATYGANGVMVLSLTGRPALSDASTSTQNVNVTADVALTANVTVNSIRIAEMAAINTRNIAIGATNTLTVGSGGILAVTNVENIINIGGTTTAPSGILTAGNGTAPAELFLNTPLGAWNSVLNINAAINDNSGQAVTVVRGFPGPVYNAQVSFNAPGNYSGGTNIHGGNNNATVAGAFGVGQVTVDQGGNLGVVPGSTSFATPGAAAYTVMNNSTIGVGAGAMGAGDTFDIRSGNLIIGNNATDGQGLRSLTRVGNVGAISGGGQIVLGSDAVVAHSSFTNDAFNGISNQGGSADTTIHSLGTAADLYFGIAVDFNAGTAQRLQIGLGTPWKGISSYTWDGDRYQRLAQGAIDVAVGTTDFYLQGWSVLGVNSNYPEGSGNLIVGNGGTGVTFNTTGMTTAHIVGRVILDGNSSNFSDQMTFFVEPGAELRLEEANALGGGGASVNPATIASAIVGMGGRMTVDGSDRINGQVTIQPAGVLVMDRAFTGIGTVTVQPGGILHVTNTAAFTGTQAFNRPAGVIYRINAGDNSTIAGLNTATNAAGIYELYANNDNNENYYGGSPATVQPVFWLDGGTITGDAQARTFNSTWKGYIQIGPGGATFAGTTSQAWSGYPGLRMIEDFDLGTNTLTIGSYETIDGLPKLGTVELRGVGSRGEPGSKIVVLGNGAVGATLTYPYDPNGSQGSRYALDLIPDSTRLEIQAGATFDSHATSDVIGSIAGGGVITNRADQTWTIYTGADDTDAIFSGTFVQGHANNTLSVTKLGAGNWTLTGDSSATVNNTMSIWGGQLTLAGAGKINFNNTNLFGGKLVLDNSASLVADRLSGKPLNLYGGTLEVPGQVDVNTSIAMAGALTLNNGFANVNIVPDEGNTTTVQFASLTYNYGGTALVYGRNLGDGTGAMLKFGTAPTYLGQTATSGMNKGILPYALASSNADGSSPGFATMDAANGLRPLAAGEYNSSGTLTANQNIALSVIPPATNSMTINSLTLHSGGSVAINAGQTLSLDSGGVLADASASITGGTLAAAGGNPTRPLFFHVLGSGTTLSVGSNVYVNSDFTKTGDGTLVLQGKVGRSPDGDRRFVINGGTVKLDPAPGVLFGGWDQNTVYAGWDRWWYLHLNAGTLDLNGHSQAFRNILNNQAIGSGGNIINESATEAILLLAQAGQDDWYGGSINGNIRLARSSWPGNNQTWYLTAPQGFTGVFDITGGNTVLLDGGVLTGSAPINIAGSTLTLQDYQQWNGSVAAIRNRLAARPVNLYGGTLDWYSAHQALDTPDNISTQYVTQVALLAGDNRVLARQTGYSQALADLTIGNLVRNPGEGVVMFTGQDGSGNLGQVGSGSHVFINNLNGEAFSQANLVNGMIGAWATARRSGDNDRIHWATYKDGQGVGRMGDTGANLGFPGYDPATDLLAVAPTGNANINANPSGNITSDLTINSLRIYNPASGNITINIDPDKYLTLASGGFLKGQNGTFDVTFNGGKLTAGPDSGDETDADLVMHTHWGGNVIVNSEIADNKTGGAVKVTKLGGMSMRLTGNNSFTGGMSYNSNTTLTLANPSANGTTNVAIPSDLRVYDGTVVFGTALSSTGPNFGTTAPAGQIRETASVTVEGYGVVTFGGNTATWDNYNNDNTIANVTLNSRGGALGDQDNRPRVDSGAFGTLTITGDIASTIDAEYYRPNLNGRVVLPAGNHGFMVDNPLQYQRAFRLNANTSGAGGITKTGSGYLEIVNPQYFTGKTTVENGTLLIAGRTGDNGYMYGLNGTAEFEINAPGTLEIGWGQRDYTFLGSLGGNGRVFFSNVPDGFQALVVGGSNADSSFSGQIVSNYPGRTTLQLDKIGTGTMEFTGSFTDFRRMLRVAGGEFKMTGTGTANFVDYVFDRGTLTLDESGVVNGNRIGTGNLRMRGGELKLIGNATQEVVQNVGAIYSGGWGGNTASGMSYITIVPGAGGKTVLQASQIAAVGDGNRAGVIVVRGANLGGTPGAGTANLVATTANLRGGGGTTAVNKSIRPDMLGDTDPDGQGIGFVTQDNTTNGLRLLTSSEYAGYITDNADTQNNTWLNSAVNQPNHAHIGSLVMDTGSSVTLIGQELNIHSGLLLVKADATINVAYISSDWDNTGLKIITQGTSTLQLNASTNVNRNTIKVGPGTLSLNARFGTQQGFVQAGGTTILNAGDNTLFGGVNNQFINPIIVTDGTLELNNNNQLFGVLNNSNHTDQGSNYYVDPYPGPGIIKNSGANLRNLVSAAGGEGTFNGSIQGNINYTRWVNTTWLTNDNTYVGSTALYGGTMHLVHSGKLSGTNSVTLGYATLNLENRGMSVVDNRIPSDVPITMWGSTLSFQYAGPDAIGLQTLGQGTDVTLTGGESTLDSRPIGGTRANIVVDNLVREAGASLYLPMNGTLGRPGFGNSAVFANTINGVAPTDPTVMVSNIIPWAVTYGYQANGGYQPVTYIAGKGFMGLGNTTDGAAGFTASGSATFSGAENIYIGDADWTLSAGDKAVNSVLFRGDNKKIAFNANGQVLTFNAGLLMNNRNDDKIINISDTANKGIIKTGMANGEMFVYVADGGNDRMNMNAILADNGAVPMKLIKRGGGSLWLYANNTFTGGATVNGGQLYLSNAAADGTNTKYAVYGPLVVNNANVYVEKPNQFRRAGGVPQVDVLLNGGKLFINQNNAADMINNLTFDSSQGVRPYVQLLKQTTGPSLTIYGDITARNVRPDEHAHIQSADNTNFATLKFAAGVPHSVNAADVPSEGTDFHFSGHDTGNNYVIVDASGTDITQGGVPGVWGGYGGRIDWNGNVQNVNTFTIAPDGGPAFFKSALTVAGDFTINATRANDASNNNWMAYFTATPTIGGRIINNSASSIYMPEGTNAALVAGTVAQGIDLVADGSRFESQIRQVNPNMPITVNEAFVISGVPLTSSSIPGYPGSTANNQAFRLRFNRGSRPVVDPGADANPQMFLQNVTLNDGAILTVRTQDTSVRAWLKLAGNATLANRLGDSDNFDIGNVTSFSGNPYRLTLGEVTGPAYVETFTSRLYGTLGTNVTLELANTVLTTSVADAFTNGAVRLTGGTLNLRNDSSSGTVFGGAFDVASGTSIISVDRESGTGTGMTMGIGSFSFQDATLVVNSGNAYGLWVPGATTIGGTGAAVLSNAAVVTLSGDFGGSGNLTKNGAGTVNIAAATNSYSGNLSVNAGVVSLQGDMTSGGVRVNTGGTLNLAGGATRQLGRLVYNGGATTWGSGSDIANVTGYLSSAGTISNADKDHITFATGAGIAPGVDGVGTITFAAGRDLVVPDGFNYYWDYASNSSSDRIAVAGGGFDFAGTTVNPTLVLRHMGTGDPALQEFTIATWTGADPTSTPDWNVDAASSTSSTLVWDGAAADGQWDNMTLTGNWFQPGLAGGAVHYDFAGKRLYVDGLTQTQNKPVTLTATSPVIIAPAAGASVTGPAANTTVGSLTVGGPAAGATVLSTSTGALTVAGLTDIQANGQIIVADQPLSTGTLALSGGTLTVPATKVAGATTSATVNSGLLEVTGNFNTPVLNLPGGAANFYAGAGGSVATANVTGGGATFHAGANTAVGTLNVSAGTATIANTSVSNALVSGTGGVALTGSVGVLHVTAGTATTSGAATVNSALFAGASAVSTTGDLIVNTGITNNAFSVNASGAAVKVSGSDLANQYGQITLNGGNVTFTGSSAPTAGLVNYWKLDESSGATTFVDSVGGRDGTFVGTGSSTMGPSRYPGFNNAIDFTRANTQYVNVGSVGFTGKAQRTIAGWFKSDSTSYTAWATLFGFSQNTGGNGTFFDAALSSASRMAIHAYGADYYFGTGADINLNWHFIAATLDADGQTIKTYLDPVAAAPNSTAIHTTLNIGDNFRIGGRLDTNGYVEGMVDEVRLYNRALTPVEILQLYQSTGSSAGPVGAVGTDVLLTENTTLTLTTTGGLPAALKDLMIQGGKTMTLAGNASGVSFANVTTTGGTAAIQGSVPLTIRGPSINVAGDQLTLPAVTLGSGAAATLTVNSEDEGTLVVSGATTLAAGWNLNIAGGTLAGTGPVVGPVSAADGVHLSPGVLASTTATLTLGDLDLTGNTGPSLGTVLDFDFGAPETSDLIAVTGTLRFPASGHVTLNLADVGGLAEGIYTLFSYNALDSFSEVNSIAIGNTPLLDKGYTFSNDAVNHVVKMTVAPGTIAGEWGGAATGNWSEPTSWAGNRAPYRLNDTAKFGSLATAPVAVTLDDDKTISGVEFASTNKYTITGAVGKSLTLDNGGSDIPVTVTHIPSGASAHEIAANLILSSDLAVGIADAGDSLAISGPIDQSSAGMELTKAGSGTLVLGKTGTHTTNTYSGGTTVSGGVLQIDNAEAIPSVGTLTITDGTVKLSAGLGRAVDLGGLSITLTSPSPSPMGGAAPPLAEVPEPGTLLLLVAGLLTGLAVWFRRRR